MAQTQYVATRMAIVNTSDAAQTTAFAYDVPAGCAVYVKAVVIAKSADGSAMYSEEFDAGVNNATGAAVLGVVKSLFATLSSVLGTLLGLGAPSSTLDVSGGQVRVRVTGKASTALQWQVHVKLFVN